MPVNRKCKDCPNNFLAYNTIQNRCMPCTIKRQKPRTFTYSQTTIRQIKPIAKKGKVTLQYEHWRDTVAKPYLDKTFGICCSKCGRYPPIKDDGTYYRHDVDHILKRGSHPHLRMVLSNVRYLCRKCHREETDK